MTIKRLIAVIFIFVCTFIAWMILGGVNLQRTTSSWEKLHQEVRSLYGDSLVIRAPRMEHVEMEPYEVLENGVHVTRYNRKVSEIDPGTQRVHVQIALDQRKKGTLWFPTFKAAFHGTYVFPIPRKYQNETVHLFSPFGNNNAIYRNIRVTVNGRPRKDISAFLKNEPVEVASPGEEVTFEVAYNTTGMGDVRYLLSPDSDAVRQIHSLLVQMQTDFENYDLVDNTLSPTNTAVTESGMALSWKLENAVTGKEIGITIPNRLNPGEILSRITFFAPVPLLFFFFIMMMVSILKGISIHPMHYFFLATAFFSFHLIFSYYSDHMNIYVAFAVASVVSIALTASYLRLFTPAGFAFGIAPVAQFIYLVVFSFSFFFKGTSGMIGATFAVLTLAVMMQLTGKLNWEEVFSGNRKKTPVSGSGESA
jgi:inner membrane protein involved in colicin E2 resistance